MIKVVVKAQDGTRELTLTDNCVVLGRAGECGIKLTDLKASRRHAQLEKVGSEWRLKDLESPNGTRLNGREVDGAPVNAGDEIRIGETSILITEIDTPPVSRPKTEVVEKQAVPIERKLEVKNRIDDMRRVIDEARDRESAPVRLKILRRLAGVAVLLILATGAAIVGMALLRETPGTADKLADRRDKQNADLAKAAGNAEAALAELRAKVERAEAITDDLIGEASQASLRYGASMKVGQNQLNPFDQLVASLLQRRAEIFTRRFGEARDQVEAALTARKYGDALAALSKFNESADRSYEDAVRELVEDVDLKVNEDFIAVRAFGRRLEETKRYADAAVYYRANSPRFAGTKHYELIKDKPEALTVLAKAEADAVAAKNRPPAQPENPIARQPEQPVKPEPPTPEQPAAKSRPSGFAARIADLVAAGKFSGRTYRFDEKRSGVPVEADGEALTVKTSAEDVKVAWTGIAPAVLFKMASDVSRGDELLAVAEFGLANGLKDDGDKLLVRILNADKKANKDKVDAVVAKARGVAVPEGGYAWDGKHGWEDAVQHDNRLAVETAVKHMKDFIASNDAKKRDALFTKAMEIHDKTTLTAQTREQVKQNTMGALKEWKKKNLESIEKRAKAMTATHLRALKVELNVRRKAALDVIYDTKIYFPEDHPNWQKGDKINGQQEVDRLVGLVRDIYEKSGSVVIGMDPSVRRDLAEIKEANEKYLTALGEQVNTEEELKQFEEICANASENQLNIKNYSLNGAEAGIYSWNRRCERYNENCREEGVTGDEKSHAKVVNDYREMMGRKRCFLDGRICKATKKHSAACDAAGRIWHVGSDGDPQSRAKAEGFTAGVGENVAIGYSHPSDIWWTGWYRASDHHRNGLSDAWNCIGYGYVGRVGTQNFSNIGAPKGF